MSTISENLLSAYRWNRAADTVKLYPRPKGAMATATEALERARFDIAASRTRYSSGPWVKAYPAVSWQDMRIGNLPFPQYKTRHGHVENPAAAGLRLVGRVMPECGGRNGYWDKSEDCG